MAQRRVTIDDIARESNASPTTVSLVLRDKPGISTETRERVLAVARSLGYQHRGPVRTAVGSEPINVALIMRTQARYGESGMPSMNPFYSWVMAGIEAAARARDMNLLYGTLTVDEEDRHADIPTHLLQQPLDGLLLVGAFTPETIQVVTAARSGPVVLVDAASGLPGVDAVVTDNLTGARDATAHLVAHGHRRIAWLGVPEGQNPNFDQRLRGYREVLAAHGLDPIEGRITRGDVAGAVAELWSRGAGITAVFAANDRFALGAMGTLNGMGVSVPDDVSVMGFDNIDLSANPAVALTTVSVDKGSLGRLAVETLAYRRAWPEAAEIVVALRPRVVQRGTVSHPSRTPVTAEGAVAVAI